MSVRIAMSQSLSDESLKRYNAFIRDIVPIGPNIPQIAPWHRHVGWLLTLHDLNMQWVPVFRGANQALYWIPKHRIRHHHRKKKTWPRQYLRSFEKSRVINHYFGN
jgi:hypothetical protein